MSSGDLSNLLEEEYVKLRVKKILEDLVVRMNRVLRGYLGATQSTIMRYYGIKPVMEVNSNIFEYGVEYHITLYIDPRDVKKIEEMARRELEDKRVRIEALRKILAQELKSASGEVSAILQTMYRGSGEGVKEAGGGGAEAWSEEGRSANKGSSEGVV